MEKQEHWLEGVKVYKRFALVSLATIIGVSVLGVLLSALDVFDVDSISATIVTCVIPAMDAGRSLARRTDEDPGQGAKWRISLIFAGISFAESFLVMAAGVIFLGLDNPLANPRAGELHFWLVFAGVACVFGLMFWGLIRCTFGLGLRMERKRLNRAPA
ncbi:hypothetical protein LA6_003303 [Marinibacterium anthonyi]|nr:hypothetical protein LA6_003303 [Marinibacterium anthonyi]